MLGPLLLLLTLGSGIIPSFDSSVDPPAVAAAVVVVVDVVFLAPIAKGAERPPPPVEEEPPPTEEGPSPVEMKVELEAVHLLGSYALFPIAHLFFHSLESRGESGTVAE